jgi:hypothetical protein
MSMMLPKLGTPPRSSINIGFKPDNILVMTAEPKLHNYAREKTVGSDP